jgi:hypothetical protein
MFTRESFHRSLFFNYGEQQMFASIFWLVLMFAGRDRRN